MYCRKCGTNNADSRGFCANCGAPLNPSGASSSASNPVNIAKDTSNQGSNTYSQSNNNAYGYSNGPSYQGTNNYQSGPSYQNQTSYQNGNAYQNQNTYQNGYQNQNTYQPNTYPGNAPVDRNTPISTWGYIGYMFLFTIPLVGIIMLFIFAFDGSTNINLRNFARAYLILRLIAVILVVILFLVTGTIFSNIFGDIIRDSSYYRSL